MIKCRCGREIAEEDVDTSDWAYYRKDGKVVWLCLNCAEGDYIDEMERR